MPKNAIKNISITLLFSSAIYNNIINIRIEAILKMISLDKHLLFKTPVQGLEVTLVYFLSIN